MAKWDLFYALEQYEYVIEVQYYLLFLHLDYYIDFKPCTLITMKYNLDVKHTL